MSFLNVLKEKLQAQQIWDELKGKYEMHFNVNGVDYAFIATSVGGDVNDDTIWYLEFENTQSHRLSNGDNDKNVIKAMVEAVKTWVEETGPYSFFTHGSTIESMKAVIEGIKKAVKKYNVTDDTADKKDEQGNVIEGNPIGKVSWNKMADVEVTPSEEKADTKSIEFEKTFEEPKDLKTTKDFTKGTSKTDKLDKGDKSYELKTESVEVGKTVTIPKDLTTDPINKQGKSGKVIKVTDDVVEVKFDDNKVGKYKSEIFESTGSWQDFKNKRINS
jgi:hypothetical protein